MTKKILLGSIFTLVVTIGGIVYAAHDFPVLTKQIEVRQAHLEWRGAIHEVSMETSIDYIDEISEGAGTSELSSILNTFKNQVSGLKTLTTHVAINNSIRQMVQTVTAFRAELRQKLTGHGGKVVQLLVRIATAVDESRERLDGLKDTYWLVRKNNELAIFDQRVEWAQNILNKIGEKGYDITGAQAKLDEIKTQRSELENALTQKNHADILHVHLEILNLSKELRQIVKNLQIEIPPKVAIKYWINVGDRVVERTETIISELETLGFDVTKLKEIHSRAKGDLQKAQDEFDVGNLEGAVEALKALKADLIELRDAYKDLVFGSNQESIQNKVESTIEALNSTIPKMEKAL